MRLSFGQEMRLAQKQVLAPRMIQSMEILQLPILALQERIDQELQENPTLELQETDPDLPTDTEDVDSGDSGGDEERELVIDEEHGEDDFERLLNLDQEEWPDHFEENSRPSSNRISEESDRKHDAMANMADRPESLQDHLHDQLSWFDLSPEVRSMADLIIYNLDSNGYLQSGLHDLLGADANEKQLARMEEALKVVQGLDPPGVAARDLRECLLLQLTPGIPFYEQLQRLISNHLEDIEQNRIPIISKKTGYSIDVIQEAIGELKKLNPKPGAEYNDTYVPSVTPDVFVDPREGGGYEVRLEDGRTPRLFVSPKYREMLRSDDSAEAREYIKRKLNSAQWLIESIEQRRSTLTKVSQAIVDHQTEFLDKGPEAIEPLKMQQIADKVGVHVTTVSRAVDDKWIQTPRGIFPLKRFFCGGTVSADGEEVAWDTVRLKLQEIVDGEDKSHPFSDDQLVAELGKHGITVARRTVTKYRKSMDIPSSRQRRDWTSNSKKG